MRWFNPEDSFDDGEAEPFNQEKLKNTKTKVKKQTSALKKLNSVKKPTTPVARKTASTTVMNTTTTTVDTRPSKSTKKSFKHFNPEDSFASSGDEEDHSVNQDDTMSYSAPIKQEYQPREETREEIVIAQQDEDDEDPDYDADADLTDDEDEDLPPPMTIEEVIRRSKTSNMEEEEMVEPGREVEMEMDEEEVQLVEEGMRAARLEENDETRWKNGGRSSGQGESLQHFDRVAVELVEGMYRAPHIGDFVLE